jgi:hypothetical protein
LADKTFERKKDMDELDRPNLSEQELWEFLYYDEDLPVSRRAVKWAVLRREIAPTRLGNGNYFSRRDGLDWIKSRKQYRTYPMPENPAAVGE